MALSADTGSPSRISSFSSRQKGFALQNAISRCQLGCKSVLVRGVVASRRVLLVLGLAPLERDIGRLLGGAHWCAQLEVRESARRPV